MITDHPFVREPALREELLSLMEKDQAVRKDWVNRHNDPAFAEAMAAVNRVGTARIKAIVAEQGWPTLSLVGSNGAPAAFLLVQLAKQDREFMNREPLMKDR